VERGEREKGGGRWKVKMENRRLQLRASKEVEDEEEGRTAV
jgi:hypothetical protein